MSLVAYNSSDDGSDSEGEKEAEAPDSDASSNQAANARHAELVAKTEDIISESETELGESDGNSLEEGERNRNINILLKALPKAKEVNSSVLEEDDVLEEEVRPKASQMVDVPERPRKKAKLRVKISVPALPDSDEEDEPAQKKVRLAPTARKAGLLSLLPAPMFAAKKETNRILVPHTLTKKPKPAESKPASVNSATKVSTAKPHALKGLTSYSSASDSEEEEDDNGGNGPSMNFFSLESSSSSSSATKPMSVLATPDVSEPNPSAPTVSLPPSMQHGTTFSSTVDSDTASHSKLSLPAPKHFTESGGDSQKQQQQQQAGSLAYSSSAGSSIDPDAPLTFKGGVQVKQRPVYSQPNSYPGPLDYHSQYPTDIAPLEEDEMFLRMQGKKQRGREEINIVDVNADDFISTVEVAKNLSEEQDLRPQPKKENMPTSQQRRKHQISYLAFQAKERELELKNQWASNRLTKKQTQAKYGF